MNLEKLDNKIVERLYKVFEDNNGFMVKEDNKYAIGTNEVLDLNSMSIEELNNIRNRFVYTISDIITPLREIAGADKLLNVYMNMMQYVTTEIDIRIVKFGGNV